MKNREEKDDSLMRYLVSDTREKAPDGFTEKVMTRVTLERISAAGRRRSPVNAGMLAAAAIVVAAVSIAISFLPGGEVTSAITTMWDSLAEALRIPLSLRPEKEMADIDIPAMFIYLSVSVLLLVLFDRLLSVLFARTRPARN